MKTISVSKPFTYEGVTVLGGWKVGIPEAHFHPDDAALLRYAREFQRIGASPLDSLGVAEGACHRLWEIQMLIRVKNSVGWHAKTYKDSFGDLRGFDASRVALKFVPYMPKFTGRGGTPTMRALMAAMREGIA